LRSAGLFAAAACLLGGCVSHGPQVDWTSLSTEMQSCGADAAPTLRAGKPDAMYPFRYLRCMTKGPYELRIKRPGASTPDMTALSSDMAACGASSSFSGARPDAYASTYLSCLRDRGYTVDVVFENITIVR
jgi:hypothetical protein